MSCDASYHMKYNCFSKSSKVVYAWLRYENIIWCAFAAEKTHQTARLRPTYFAWVIWMAKTPSLQRVHPTRSGGHTRSQHLSWNCRQRTSIFPVVLCILTNLGNSALVSCKIDGENPSNENLASLAIIYRLCYGCFRKVPLLSSFQWIAFVSVAATVILRHLRAYVEAIGHRRMNRPI